MELLALAVVVAAVVVTVGMWQAAGQIAASARIGVMGGLGLRGHEPPYPEDGDLDDLREALRWEEWNVHMPPWAREDGTSFGEALVVQLALLATAHNRLAAAVERLAQPPTSETTKQ